MANHNPSIVVASLDDSQLRKSIDELVQHVKASFDTMAQYATTSVNAIKDSIKSIDSVKTNFGKNFGSNNESAKRIQKNAEEAKSMNNVAVSYDNAAKAMQNAAQPKNAQQSFYAFIQSYREQAAKLANEIKNLPSDSLNRQFAEYQRLEKEISNVQERVKKLNEQYNQLAKNPNSTLEDMRAIQTEIAGLEQKIKSLTAEQLANVKKIEEEDKKALAEKTKSYNEQIRLINELTNKKYKASTFIDSKKEEERLARENAERLKKEAAERERLVVGLREKIALLKKEREYMQLGSEELKSQNAEIRIFEYKLKQALKSQSQLHEELEKYLKKLASSTIQGLMSMSESNLDKMEKKLAAIQEYLKNMEGKNILNEAQINRLTNKAEKLRESIDKIRNTPKTTKDVLGMPEKTLDDIAKKLQAINQVKNQLNINTQRNEISRLNAEAQRLSGLQNDILGKNQKLITSNRALESAIGYIRNRIIYALTLGATTNFVKEVYEIRGQYELLERSLGVLVNSFENGKKIFQDLNEMAIKSPFTLIELGSAAKQLTAYNFAANEVVDVTRRMADLSAALGVPMERLTYNLGQIRAQTVLTARDARDFANAGLPIVKKLSDYYTELENKVVSTGDVYDRMSKKMVSYNDVMAVLYQMTDKGGKFFDFQAKQAETLRVQLANLTLAFNNMLNEIGEEHQQLLAMPLKLLKSLLENWRTINSVISSVAIALGAYKAAQMLTNAIVGKTVNSIERQIVAEKQLEAARLRKKALTTQLSIEELRLLANTKTVTTADYERLLIENKISAGQAMRLILFNKNNMMLRQAAINTGILTERQVALAASGNYLKVMLKSVGLSLQAFGQTLKSLFVGNIYTLAIMAITTAIWELYSAFSSANEAAESLMEGIKTAANEASASLDKFINSIKEANVLAKISEGSFSDNEGKKVWAGMKEEIQNSVLTANELLMRLEEIDDIGERIKIGNDMLTNLSQAKKIVADISEEYLNISTDTLGGLFGEGLVSDLKDYYDAVKEVIWVVDNLGYAQLQASEYGKNQMKSLEEATEEANSEIEKTFNGFWKLIEKRDIKDPLMIAEMLEHVKDKIKQDNPKIKGELENLFDIHMDELLAEKTDNAYDKNTSLWKIFMKELKKNSNSTFLEIGDQLTESQQKAINENTEYFKESMPQWYEAIKEMVQDASKLKVMIDVTFDRKELTNLQQTFQERIGNNWELRVYMPKENQDVLDWAKELRSQRDDYINQSKALKKIDTDWANTEAKRLSDAASDINKSLDLMHQSLEDEKKSTKSEKDVLGEAIKQEISLIKDMQSNYDKLRKAGVGDFEAIELAARGYEATLRRVNAVLSQYGIDKFNASDFAGKNSRDMLDFLVTQRELLTKNPKVKTSAIEALDVEIQKLNIDAKTYDLKKITDGLNNELSKIDEQYELAVELQANADLGNQLIDMFGLDTSQFPQDIDQYVQAYQNALWDAIAKVTPNIDLSQEDILKVDFKKLLSGQDIDSDFMKGLLNAQKKIKQETQKWTQDIYNQTKQLQYDLADINGKIALKEEEIARLREKYLASTNQKQKELLALQIKEQENQLAELKEGILQLMPTYKRLFGSIVEHSAVVTRKLAEQLKGAYEDAQARGKNEKGEYTFIDPITLERVTLSEKQLGNEINKVDAEIRKSASNIEKMAKAFKGDEDGVKDFTKGLEYLSQEIQNASQLVSATGNLAEVLGMNKDTVEDINNVSKALSGAGEVVEGIAKIKNKDYIGGAAGIVSGLAGVVGGLLGIGNSNRRITREVEKSEKAVKKLENAYKDLEYQVNKSMGTAETSARRAAIANKELQLAELQRQLVLEESRKKKNQDEDKILGLRGSIKDLQHEIQDMVEDVVNNLTGSDIKSAAEEFVDTWVQAWKAGETTLDAVEEKMDSVIENIIKKAMTNKIVGAILDPFYKEVDRMTSRGSEGEEQLTIGELRTLAEQAGVTANDINIALGEFYGNLESLGIVAKAQEQTQQLSALQQGIQGITEDTAGALEAYANIIGQQNFAQTQLLTEIRDALVMTDSDLGMGVQAQMLLQLQQSYQVHVSIRSILEGVLTPSGTAFNAQLI